MDSSPTRRTARLLGVGARTLGRSLLKRLPGGDAAQRKVDYWTDVGRDWAQTLGEMRGAAMKLGQLASQYADVLPPQLAEQLKKLQNAAEPIPFAKVEAALAERWSAEQRAQVAHIEPKALASASIGQVHRARLADGRDVVVKVRYPGVERAVDADLTQLRRLIGMSKLLPVDDSAMDKLMGEVRARFRDETDYGTELVHLRLLRADAALPGIVYPEPLESLCGPGVLVLSEEPGVSLEMARTWSQQRRDALALTLCRWLAHQLFVAHAVHADPHPGNFAFREETGEIVVYDFGCVKRVPPAVVADVREIIDAFSERNWPRTHAALDRLGGLADKTPLKLIEPLYRDIERLMTQPLANPDGFDFSDPAFIPALRDNARAHLGLTFKFKPVTDMVFVLRAVSGLYWLMRGLGARVDLNAVLAEHGLTLRRP
ncbi:putative unusual protein kinase regulating ubiquinone biosynthesis (AarF/ABC1/UbiB family) [Panacagrimonas perspica]|uniref:Putative unusual protein kinase regulating ubiquinone biosynthesis (AarF/ABC1/UbiB family) n=1 Tax=Panacagrimonas perspica TaxID=381431 RepID=A0A4R7P5Y5_9GAMM|nr:AarF/ABC1/UbiB kinase family protein [Panacagrimonas perspica]TDU28661.1 putative unusual protein kinase regulating ubiquinone biosynthesis (AarF/ABC1/UbiB family) [Panacagrimonas perspica]THD04988.1 hypothetical protein B1810_03320 [Panacagrimonas perspica]